VEKTLQVLVHEGGPAFTAARPELLSARLLKSDSDSTVMTGRLLKAPRALRAFSIGDTISFIRVSGYPHPILVTDKYLRERRNNYIIPCDKCGFSELFDCPSELAAAMFPGRSVSTFTSRCPICGGNQLVRILPSAPSTPRGAPKERIVAVIRSIVAEQFGKEASSISPDQPLTAQGADELDLLAIVFALEEHFVVSIPDRQIGDHLTLIDLIEIVTHTITERRDDDLLHVPG